MTLQGFCKDRDNHSRARKGWAPKKNIDRFCKNEGDKVEGDLKKFDGLMLLISWQYFLTTTSGRWHCGEEEAKVFVTISSCVNVLRDLRQVVSIMAVKVQRFERTSHGTGAGEKAELYVSANTVRWLLRILKFLITWEMVTHEAEVKSGRRNNCGE